MSRIKYLRHPTFTYAQWSQRNPLLEAGEIGYEILDDGTIVDYKVGPGIWNDLPYAGKDNYPYAEEPTNPIGDAKGVLQDKPLSEILHLMLNPFAKIVVVAAQNDAGGKVAANIQTFEVGEQLSGSINVLYSVNNPPNLAPIPPAEEPITVTSNPSIFTNEGEFPYGTAIMSLDGILKPLDQQTYNITVKASDSEGNTNSRNTTIKFLPRLQWGTSSTDTVDSILSNDIVPKVILSAQKFSLSSSYKRDYDITSVGYTWLVIPLMLNPTNLVFTDVTDPNAPAGYAMEDMGSRNIDTGVGQYECQFYRSTYYLNSNGILRVS